MSSMSVRPPRRGAVAVNSGDELRYDRRWFGDEAAVDFPSTAPAVERITSGSCWRTGDAAPGLADLSP